jgi:hypothetical protein
MAAHTAFLNTEDREGTTGVPSVTSMPDGAPVVMTVPLYTFCIHAHFAFTHVLHNNGLGSVEPLKLSIHPTVPKLSR